MRKSDTENIFEAAFPFACFLKFVGMLPFSFDGAPGRGICKVTVIDKVVIALSLTFHLGLLGLNLQSHLTSDRVLNTILDIGWLIVLYFGLFACCACICLQVVNREHIVQFLLVLHNFDEKVSGKIHR